MFRHLVENSSFARPYRLKSRTVIKRVFEEGHKSKAWPVLLRYIDTDLSESVPCQATVSVSKRQFKRAVDRNRIKRLIREAWRLEKPALEKVLTAQGKRRAIVFIFVGNEIPTFLTAHKSLQSAIQKMLRQTDCNTHA